MENIYQGKIAKIIKIKKETENVKLFRLKFEKNIDSFYFEPGQFIELGIPGFGEAPFAICSSPKEKRYFEICVRKAGQLTTKLFSLKVNDFVSIRGPFGQGCFPKLTRNFLMVAGGLGIIPLRSLILSVRNLSGEDIKIFYGARKPDDFLFRDEFKEWEKRGFKVFLTIDKPVSGWKGEIGVVTTLFDKVFKKVSENKLITVVLCGPPIMYRFVLEKLMEYKFQEKNIYLSLERRMHCGVGTCQHCIIGSYYVCKDGPVFSWSKIKNIYGAI